MIGLNYTEASVHEVEITCDDGLLADNKIFYIYVLVNGMPAILNLQRINLAPVITNLPATVQISEDAAAGSSIFAISVYDDNDDNGDTSFTASATYNPTSGAAKFSIDDSTLKYPLRLVRAWTTKTVTQYVLNMTVSDDSDTSDWGLLTVEVADVNEQPQLLKNSYSVVQDEGLVENSATSGSSDTATVYVTITEDDSDGFWDSGANIAWHSTMVAAMAL
nr:hypothetical protein BaRGS_028405 [Batillaria attramentaria]